MQLVNEGISLITKFVGQLEFKFDQLKAKVDPVLNMAGLEVFLR